MFRLSVDGHSVESPGAHKWHRGQNYADELQRNLWVRCSLFHEIVGSNCALLGFRGAYLNYERSAYALAIQILT